MKLTEEEYHALIDHTVVKLQEKTVLFRAQELYDLGEIQNMEDDLTRLKDIVLQYNSKPKA